MKKKYTIGVLIGNATSPHTMELMRGIYNAEKQEDVNILFFLGIHSSYYYRAYFGDEQESNYDYQFNTIYEYAWLGKVDVLIISYGSLGIFLQENDKEKFLSKFTGIPYVLIEERDESYKGTSIISDNYHGMYKLTEHLVQTHGYRNFVYLSGPENNTDAEERKFGVMDALKKHGVELDASRIEIGDFTSCVEEKVNHLLNCHPDTQVLMCANDIMADTAYKECIKRGLVVGVDIAITGYDDWEVAETMNPPLTTILQNGYDMGYQSVQCAIELCMGKAPRNIVAPAEVILRASCGCKMKLREVIEVERAFNHRKPEEYIEDLSKKILDKIILVNMNDDILQGVYQQIYNNLQESIPLFFSDQWRQLDSARIIKQVNSTLLGPYMTYISANSLTSAINSFFTGAMLRCQNPVKRERLSSLLDSIQGTMKSFQLKASTDKYSAFQRESWFMPQISRDMMNHIDNEQKFYREAMKKISALKSRSAYLFIFERPIVHKGDEEWICPERLLLASYHRGDLIVAYESEQRPVITKKNGMLSYCSYDRNIVMSAFNLFSGEVQYGLLLSEIQPEDISLIYSASMQIGIALHVHAVSCKQRVAQECLQALIKEVNEKNEVLNFISGYDELTSCLNRRGFMERALALNNENIGKNAAIIFCDLDHLKEINDTYGHIEGDFAIKKAAYYLEHMKQEKDIVGRIGGDEFVLMRISDEVECAKNMVHSLKLLMDQYNTDSEKDYYIELSLGYREYKCSEEISITEILAEADKILYQEKRKRRESVKKQV